MIDASRHARDRRAEEKAAQGRQPHGGAPEPRSRTATKKKTARIGDGKTVRIRRRGSEKRAASDSRPRSSSIVRCCDKPRLAGPTPPGVPGYPAVPPPGHRQGCVYAPYGRRPFNSAIEAAPGGYAARGVHCPLDPSAHRGLGSAQPTPLMPGTLKDAPVAAATCAALGRDGAAKFTRWAKSFDRWLARTRKQFTTKQEPPETVTLGPKRGGVSVELVAIVWERRSAADSIAAAIASSAGTGGRRQPEIPWRGRRAECPGHPTRRARSSCSRARPSERGAAATRDAAGAMPPERVQDPLRLSRSASTSLRRARAPERAHERSRRLLDHFRRDDRRALYAFLHPVAGTLTRRGRRATARPRRGRLRRERTPCRQRRQAMFDIGRDVRGGSGINVTRVTRSLSVHRPGLERLEQRRLSDQHH